MLTSCEKNQSSTIILIVTGHLFVRLLKLLKIYAISFQKKWNLLPAYIKNIVQLRECKVFLRTRYGSLYMSRSGTYCTGQASTLYNLKYCSKFGVMFM